MATQVKVTVWPREAWMDSWGGVTTWGGTGETRAGVRGVKGKGRGSGRRAGLRLWTGPREPTPGPRAHGSRPPTLAPAHCSQIHHCGRDSRSPRHSGSWPGYTCSWRHSGTAWARTRPRGAWQLGDRARRCGQPVLPSGRVTPTPYLHPTVDPAHLPLVSPGSLSLLTHVTHSCPDETHTLLPQHCQLSPAGHQMAITLPCPHHSRHLHSPKQRCTWHITVTQFLPHSASLRSPSPLSKAQAK